MYLRLVLETSRLTEVSSRVSLKSPPKNYGLMWGTGASRPKTYDARSTGVGDECIQAQVIGCSTLQAPRTVRLRCLAAP